jgi:RimJ/RimL family protein N-acetyltransferase
MLTDGVIMLRCLADHDAAAHLAGEDDDLIRWLSGGPGSLERLLPWIHDNREQWATGGPRRNFGVFDVASTALVGNAEAHLAMRGLEPGAVNISYGVFPQWRGRGIARRAVSLIGHWLRTQPAYATVVIRVAPDNIHSLRVPEALGFQRVGPSTSPRGEELIRFDKALQRDTGGQPAQDARLDDAASHRQ